MIHRNHCLQPLYFNYFRVQFNYCHSFTYSAKSRYYSQEISHNISIYRIYDILCINDKMSR